MRTRWLILLHIVVLCAVSNHVYGAAPAYPISSYAPLDGHQFAYQYCDLHHISIALGVSAFYVATLRLNGVPIRTGLTRAYSIFFDSIDLLFNRPHPNVEIRRARH